MSVPSTALLVIVSRLDASRKQQHEWAEKAADQKQHDWSARYTSVADAYTEAIDMLNEAIANSAIDMTANAGLAAAGLEVCGE